MLKISVAERFQSTQDVLWALGMEPYLPNLTNCLSNKRLGDYYTHSQDESSQQYSSPVSRSAQAIRQWRAKLKAKTC